ncbi:hypothetical protein LTS18_007770 [Coniosporium uncinatum]|uniref:Uncharacterized protein n=1 Tax=Coniosporium uncinatum TaxID=93489 RepID=A0ACC3DP67_9PEZI|nr:hypothetical protein LTS18_007770 [Coniosporium uncinatum]
MDETVIVEVDDMYGPDVWESAGALEEPAGALEAGGEEELADALEAVADEDSGGVLLEPAEVVDDEAMEDVPAVMLEDGPSGRFDVDDGTESVFAVIVDGSEAPGMEDGTADALVAGPFEEATGEEDGTEFCDPPETEFAVPAPLTRRPPTTPPLFDGFPMAPFI